MREFIVLPHIKDFELNLIEDLIDLKLPAIFRCYLKKYGGLSIVEKYFIKNNQLLGELSQFDYFKDIYDLTSTLMKEFGLKMIPFAHDPGGWNFCLCMDEKKDFGSIYIYKWTDHLPEEQFFKIADSFEEFINGLRSEDE